VGALCQQVRFGKYRALLSWGPGGRRWLEHHRLPSSWMVSLYEGLPGGGWSSIRRPVSERRGPGQVVKLPKKQAWCGQVARGAAQVKAHVLGGSEGKPPDTHTHTVNRHDAGGGLWCHSGQSSCAGRNGGLDHRIRGALRWELPTSPGASPWGYFVGGVVYGPRAYGLPPLR
jgi:hypothetical protein